MGLRLNAPRAAAIVLSVGLLATAVFATRGAATPAFCTDYFPAVGSGGGVYLVVWERICDGNSDLYGVRVSEAGQVLDETAMEISRGVAGQQYPSVAFDGANFLVTWMDGRASRLESNLDIYGTRVTPAGEVLDPDGLPIAVGAGDQWTPSTVFTGQSYLAAFPNGGNSISAQRVSTSGSAVGSDIPVSGVPGGSPATAFDGANSLVVWTDARGALYEWDIYGARVTQAGDVLDRSGIPISTAPGIQESPTLAFDGANYLAAWDDFRGGVYGSRVNRGGKVFDPAGVLLARGSVPAVAFGGTSYLLVWNKNPPDGAPDVYGTRIAPSGAVLDPDGFPIAARAGWQWVPELAYGGANYLVIWMEDNAVHGTRVSRDGAVLDPGGFLISRPTPAIPVCRVPRVVGSSLSRARARLRLSVCTVGRVRRVVGRRGKVLAQRPAPGAVLPAWSGVRLVVGKGRRR